MKDEPREGYTIFDKVTIKYYADESTMMVDFMNGVIDIALGISESDYNSVMNGSIPGTAALVDNRAVCVINMDVDIGPLTDINLRKAICYGTDIEALTAISFGSLAKVATSSLASSSPAYVSGYAYEYNPELAKQTLAENNIKDVKITWIVNSGFPATIAEAFQSMMADIGITVDVQVYDPATVMQMAMHEGATHLLLDGWAFGNLENDPYMQYMMLFSNNMNPASRKLDQKLNNMLNEARNTMNEEESKAIYKEVQKYLYDNYYQIPICEWYTSLCFNDTIANCTPVQTTMANLRFITAK